MIVLLNELSLIHVVRVSGSLTDDESDSASQRSTDDLDLQNKDEKLRDASQGAGTYEVISFLSLDIYSIVSCSYQISYCELLVNMEYKN